MSGRLTRDAYAKLVEEDIEWLLLQPRTLERDHIVAILREAVRYEYDADSKRIEDALEAQAVQHRAKLAAAESALFRVLHAPKVWRAMKNIAKRYFKGRSPFVPP